MRAHARDGVDTTTKGMRYKLWWSEKGDGVGGVGVMVNIGAV